MSPSEPIVVTAVQRFVSRGGDKLDAALDRFAVDISGAVALDAGASTGGFTDCLLQRGAARVVALDVGRGQLHDRLRRDERVRVVERTNVRHVTLDDLGEDPFPLVTADLSFISLRTVMPALAALAAPGADLVLLVKPQFEAGRPEVSRGRGVVRDPAVWRSALGQVCAALVAAPATIMGVMPSPVTGADGNVEFFVHGRTAEPGSVDDGAIDAAIAEATAREG